MPRRKKIETSVAVDSLKLIAKALIQRTIAFEDVKEQIAEHSFRDFHAGSKDETLATLYHVVSFFETLEEKNEEDLRDLADICMLIGELLQQDQRIVECVVWFEKAVIVDENYAEAYRQLARSYESLGSPERAIKALQQEITLSPGNYFAYHELARLYESSNNENALTAILEQLLERDPANIQALHTLICHYQKCQPDIEISFLRQRLLLVHGEFNHRERMIWVWHMSEVGRAAEAAHTVSLRKSDWRDLLLLALAWNLCGNTIAWKTSLDTLMEMAVDVKLKTREIEEIEKVFGKKKLLFIRKFFHM